MVFLHKYTKNQCCVQIELFISMQIQIQIQGAKPMQTHADPDPGRTLKSQKLKATFFGDR